MKTTFLKGVPELKIIKLVRRAHSASECPHEGNCLSEKEMIALLHELLVDLIER